MIIASLNYINIKKNINTFLINYLIIFFLSKKLFNVILQRRNFVYILDLSQVETDIFYPFPGFHEFFYCYCCQST